MHYAIESVEGIESYREHSRFEFYRVRVSKRRTQNLSSFRPGLRVVGSISHCEISE